jgi:pimeloyl-ACP methyl ester carboxylesterase
VSDHLHFEVDGDEGGQPLLLLHGFMSSNLQWALNRERLRGRFRLVAVELWGHGKSPTPREPARYRVEGYGAELERIRTRLGVARWLVCGQSFGAGIAIRYALARPQPVAGLIVTNSRSAFNDVSREAGESGGLDAWQGLDTRTLPFHPCHAKRFPAGLKARMESAADAIPAYALWQATATTARDLSCRQLAAGLSVPTLLVNGRYEKSFQDDRDFAVATIAGIEVADLDAGHSVNIEAPRAFDRAVIEFAQRQARVRDCNRTEGARHGLDHE